MDDKELVQDLDSRATEELIFRRKLLNAGIQLILNDKDMANDPRAPGALKRERAKLAAIDRELKKRKSPGDKGPEVRLGLKPAVLNAIANTKTEVNNG